MFELISFQSTFQFFCVGGVRDRGENLRKDAGSLTAYQCKVPKRCCSNQDHKHKFQNWVQPPDLRRAFYYALGKKSPDQNLKFTVTMNSMNYDILRAWH